MAPVLFACAVAVVLTSCTPRQEEVSVSNECASDVWIWVERVDPTDQVTGQLVPAGASSTVTYAPDVASVPVWVRVEGGAWTESAPMDNLDAFAGPDLKAAYQIAAADCPNGVA